MKRCCKCLEKYEKLVKLFGSVVKSYFSYILQSEQSSKMFADNFLLAVQSKRVYTQY